MTPRAARARSGKAAPSTLAGTGSMTDKEFQHFSSFIYQEVGIKLPPSKKVMVEARLQKRIRRHKFTSIQQYLEFLFSDRGMEEELTDLIDVITTNTTDFFREPQHFELLNQVVAPQWFADNGRSGTLRVWSAGCSIGMEPYTLAMVLTDFQERHPGFQFNILGTDISTQALQTAARAVYDEERVEPVPMEFKRKYLLRSKDRSRGLVRVAPEVRRRVEFRRLNFMQGFHMDPPMHLIFCRNVVIYFDKPTQEKLFTKLSQQLAKGGHLFIGHSESLTGMDLPLRQFRPTVYVRI